MASFEGSLSKWNLIHCLASRLIKGVVALIDGLHRLRCFSRLRAVSVLGCPVQDLHLIGYNFDYRALFAFGAFPLPGLQTTFQVNVPALVQVFAANLRQPSKAHDLEPLHSLTRGAFSIFPPFVYRKAERTDGIAFLAEPEFRCVTQKPDFGILNWPSSAV